jgi:hypothetical protein
MLITILVLLGLLSLASLATNVFLYKAGLRQLTRADVYEEMYNDIVLKMKYRIEETYVQMKQLDNVNGVEGVFSKDDEVGASFKEILSVLAELNEITQEEKPIGEEVPQLEVKE